MSEDRCPSCRGVIRSGAGWCGLCHADLRPPPPPPPAAAPRATAAAPAQVSAGTTLVRAEVDPLTAPLSALDPTVPSSGPAEPDPESAESAVVDGWPCVECGTRNDLEVSVCLACGVTFGAGLSTPGVTMPGTRQSRLVIAAVAVLGFLCLVMLLSVVTGSAPPPDGGSDVIFDQPPAPGDLPADVLDVPPVEPAS